MTETREKEFSIGNREKEKKLSEEFKLEKKRKNSLFVFGKVR